MMMGRKQKLKGGNEYDVVDSWRKLYCYLQRAGTAKLQNKKKMNRRARHDAKRKLHTREDT